MKTILKTSFIAALLMFASCNDDETNNGNDNDFVVVVDDLYGDIESGTVTLDASEVYTLTGALVVKEGATLIIPAGTTIKAKAEGTGTYIAVARFATIMINGTSSNPVVMTSAAASPAAGDWGGLVIAGDGIANTGTDSTTEVGGLVYGGANNADSSGSITYLKIEYTGATDSSSKEFNGVSLFGVGSGTVFDNVCAYESGDDGIEFFGGAVEATNLVIINAYDDSLDFADGFAGSVDGLYISGITKAGIEGSNNGDDGNATPVTNVTISNASIVVGSGYGASEGAIYFKEGGGTITYTNIYADGHVLGIKAKTADAEALARIAAGDLVVDPIQFANNQEGFVYGTLDTDADTVVVEGDNIGAGSGADLPSWATAWVNY